MLSSDYSPEPLSHILGVRRVVDPVEVRRERLTEAVGRLKPLYGSPRLNNKEDPLDELFFILLSLRTTYWSFERVYEGFAAKFRPWRLLLNADEEEVAATIRLAGISRTRARTFLALARRLQQDFGDVTLEPLRTRSVGEVEKYLLSLPGVGVKTARCVMMYSLGMDVAPVDTHTTRVAARLGLLGDETPKEKIHGEMDALVAPGLAYDFHTNFVAHGRAICRSRDPQCQDCVLNDICPTGERLLELMPHDGEFACADL
jgi:endonuclease III